MRKVNNRVNISLALVVTWIVGITVTFTSTPAAIAPLPLFDSHGGSIKSLFEGATRYPEFARSRWRMPSLTLTLCRLPHGRAAVDFLKRNAPFSTLHAFSC